MKIHQLVAAEAVASLNTTAEGLSAEEAARRLREYGPNRIEKVSGESPVLRFLKEFTHFFALILWLAAGHVTQAGAAGAGTAAGGAASAEKAGQETGGGKAGSAQEAGEHSAGDHN